MITEFTLSDVVSSRVYDPQEGWVNRVINLSDEQKDAFMSIFGKGCAGRTKARLNAFINDPRLYSNYGIYERVVFKIGCHNPPCQYVAGQSMPDEVREIRRLIMKG